MSFLEKTQFDNNKKQFYFDAARIFDSVVSVFSGYAKVGDVPGFSAGLTYSTVGQQDKVNIDILKEEMGTDFIEKQMFKQFTRNNEEVNEDDDEKNIKNKYQRDLYKDYKKVNNFVASVFLYLFHRFNYDDWPDAQITTGDNGKAAYKKIKSIGLPSSDILKEIKDSYASLHNLFVKYLITRYGSQANIALMNVQDIEHQLKDAELQGQIKQIQIEKKPELKLYKK